MNRLQDYWVVSTVLRNNNIVFCGMERVAVARGPSGFHPHLHPHPHLTNKKFTKPYKRVSWWYKMYTMVWIIAFLEIGNFLFSFEDFPWIRIRDWNTLLTDIYDIPLFIFSLKAYRVSYKWNTFLIEVEIKLSTFFIFWYTRNNIYFYELSWLVFYNNY